MNILVTGGAGYIGSHLVKLLSQNKSNKITIIDNLSTGFKSAVISGELIQEDLSNIDKIEDIFRSKKFDVVIHLAASIVVSESIDEPLKYYKNNTLNTINLIDLCNRYEVNNFIFSSTAAVYGNGKNKLVNENDHVAPLNPYGTSKLMSEQVLIDNAKANKNFKYCILRYFNVAGADIDGKLGQNTKNATHLIKLASQTALGKRDSLNIYGNDYNTVDGTCIRDYIHVLDLAQAHIDAINYLMAEKTSGIFNCGYGKGMSVLDVIKTMKKISNNDFKTKVESRRSGDAEVLIANNQKIIDKLGWKPKFNDLEIICKTSYDWEKKLI